MIARPVASPVRGLCRGPLGLRALALGCTTATPPGLGRRVKKMAHQLRGGPVGENLNAGSIPLQPRYCRVADVVAPRNLHQSLTRASSSQCLGDLVRGKLRVSPEPNPSIHRSPSTFRGSR